MPSRAVKSREVAIPSFKLDRSTTERPQCR
jgi:hypothetical protein